MDTYQRVARMWSRLFTYTPLNYLVPLADLTTFLIIIVQCVWTWYFVEQALGTNLSYETSGVFGILTATLGFILPLQMNAALGKNKACLDNYNAFLGDIQALGWDVIAFYNNSVEKSENAKQVMSEIFDILVAMPALAKWHFRGGADLNKLTTKSDYQQTEILFKSSDGGQHVSVLSTQIPNMPKPEICFFKLLDYMKDLGVSKTQQEQSASFRSWERAYGSWGNMGNLDAYKPPVLFTYVLNIALLLYSILLPFQFYAQGFHAIWMVAIIGFFFIGLNSAGSKVGNAFAEGPQGFQTVSDAQRGATKTMIQIWNSRTIIFQSPSAPKAQNMQTLVSRFIY